MHFETDKQGCRTGELAAVADAGAGRARRRPARGARPRRDEGAAGADDRGAREAAGARYEADEIDETVAFLRWLDQGNFVFLGYREYAIVDEGQGRALSVVDDSGLGILRDEGARRYAQPVPLASIEPRLRERVVGGDLLLVSKTNRLVDGAPARADGLHRRSSASTPHGEIVGELRLLGLFTSQGVHRAGEPHPAPAPQARARSSRRRTSSRARTTTRLAVELFESFPKDELFAADWRTCARSVVSLLGLQEQAQRAAVRAHRPRGAQRRRSWSPCPATASTPSCARRLGRSCSRSASTASRSTTTCRSASPTSARIHFTVHVRGDVPDVSLPELEQEVVGAHAHVGRPPARAPRSRCTARRAGGALAEKYGARLPDYYKSVDRHLGGRARHRGSSSASTPASRSSSPCRTSAAAPSNLTRVGFYKTGRQGAAVRLPADPRGPRAAVVEEVPTRLVGGDGETLPARLRRARARRHDARPRRLRRARRGRASRPSGAARPSPTRSTGWSSRPG